MPVAFRKETFRVKLVSHREVSDPRNVGESCPRYQEYLQRDWFQAGFFVLSKCPYLLNWFKSYLVIAHACKKYLKGHNSA